MKRKKFLKNALKRCLIGENAMVKEAIFDCSKAPAVLLFLDGERVSGVTYIGKPKENNGKIEIPVTITVEKLGIKFPDGHTTMFGE